MSLLRSAYRSLKIQYTQSRAKLLKGWKIHYSKKLDLYFLLNLNNYIDFLIYTKDQFEPDVLKAIKYFLETKQVSNFIDVGSNIGQMSLFVAKHFPHVQILSFEAYFKNYRQHASSILLNNFDYDLFNVAISDTDDDLVLYLPKTQKDYDWGKYNSGMPSINLDNFREEKDKIVVKSKTLENVIREYDINVKEGYLLVKIDVEGAEFVVINGFKEFLKNNSKIIIIIEMLFEKDNELYTKVMNVLLSANFNMLDIRMNQINEAEHKAFRNTDYIFIKE